MRQLGRGVPALAGVVMAATAAVGCQWPDGTRYVDHVFAAEQVRVTTDITYDTVVDFSYPGEDHFVAFTQLSSIAERTADWIFEQVLWPLGYRA